MHIETGANLGNIGPLLDKSAQVAAPDITDEQMVENFVQEEAQDENTNPDDERVLQEAAVAVEETLMALQIPEEQWPLVIQRTRIGPQ